ELDVGPAVVSFWLSFVYLWRNDWIGAERELRPSYDTLKELGETSHRSSHCQALANAVYNQGRYDEAEALTHECEETSRPNDVHSQILWRSTRAKAIAHRGEFEEAERLAQEAVVFAAKSDFYPAHADALMDLADVFESRGDRNAAAAAIEEALEFCELKGNLATSDRACARLAQLRA